MKIGYPCINLSLDCRASKGFRLASYTEEGLVETVAGNLDCLERMLEYNIKHKLLYFRISSGLVPFASHPVCSYNWQKHFSKRFVQLGKFMKAGNFRITMHPDQFIVINSPDSDVFKRSVAELRYHAQVLDLLKLDTTARIQIHVGGAYGDKPTAMKRFVKRYKGLDDAIGRRLVIENDHRSYSLADCMKIHNETGVPVAFDSFHHQLLNYSESVVDAFRMFSPTWSEETGMPLVDYSYQQPGAPRGRHASSANLGDFKIFIDKTIDFDFDIMLEIGDKEQSAVKAVQVLKNDSRFLRAL